MTNVELRPPAQSRYPFIPAPVRYLVWRSWTQARMSLRIQWWRMRNAGLVLGARRYARTPAGAWIGGLQNRLPNSGGFKIDSTPAAVIAGIQSPQARRADAEGFEGLALDDALVFTSDYKHLSYIPLARATTSIGRTEFARARFSVLELGAGGGSFFTFLRPLGVEDYLGVDVNTVAFRHSPHIQRREGHFRLLNLQESIDFGVTFDLVCTFEVLEHIREDKLDEILATIRRHLSATSLFLGTASLLEDHDVHVTVKERSFWLDRFARHDLVPHPRHEEYERLLGAHHAFNWTPETTNVFALHVRP